MSNSDKAYIVTVDMGYGHQRASYAMKQFAACPNEWEDGKIVLANNYAGIPKSDEKKWKQSQKFYETVSRMKNSIPFLGEKIFDAMDYFQKIEPFYPKRDLSDPTLQVKQIYKMVRSGWGEHLIDKLNEDPKPYITTFFTTAYFAEEHGYKGEIYCLCTDTDVSRAWAPLDPQQSDINYLAPTKRVRERLKLYGVKEENIYTTGFPLPEENIGDEDKLDIVKDSLSCRIAKLDPNEQYINKYEKTIKNYVGKPYCDLDSGADDTLTVTFAVGGAGAQREIGATILDSLHEKIDRGDVRLNLVAGSRNDVYRFYNKKLQKLELEGSHGDMLNIIYDPDKQKYFEKFNQTLLSTDVLWTKPSELTFYSGLGIPIIMAPTIGSQEEFNKDWLLSIGAGFEQRDPRYTDQWLFDWLESGWLAEAAMEGFLDAPIHGAYNIEDVVLENKQSEISDRHLL